MTRDDINSTPKSRSRLNEMLVVSVDSFCRQPPNSIAKQHCKEIVSVGALRLIDIYRFATSGQAGSSRPVGVARVAREKLSDAGRIPGADWQGSRDASDRA